MKIKNAADLREAKQKRSELYGWLKENNKEAMTADEQRAWDEKRGELETIDADISAYEAAQERNALLANIETRQQAAAQPANGTRREYAQVRQDARLHLFGNLGEQLRAVYLAEAKHEVDERLHQLNAEARALGASEGVGADGGFAVQTDFAGNMFDSAVQEGDILPRVDSYEVSAGSNGVKWNAIDEDDTSAAYGGVKVYWVAEGKTANPSGIKTRQVKIELEKLMGFAYATEELMQDTNFMAQLYERSFKTAINYMLEGDVIAGPGVGRPLGISKSDALVVVAKESSQANDTVLFENIVHMRGAMAPRSWKSAVWLMHPDVEEILPFMHMPVGTGGVPVYLPASGISQDGYATLFGKPVISTEHCASLGDQGDIILADLMQYQLLRKGGVQSAQSMHVQFLTAEQCFRFIFRANGRPKLDKQLTIKNSAKKRSPFVALAAR